MLDDVGLVRQAQGGDVRAFEALVERHQRSVFALCYTILRSREEAEDAAQEAFVVAWERLPALAEPLAWKAWLRRIAVSRSIDAARRRARRHAVSPLAQSASGAVGAVSDSAPLVASRDQIERALARLAPEDRALIALRFYLDLEVADAASAVGMRVGTAKSRLHRAMARLRTLLEDSNED